LINRNAAVHRSGQAHAEEVVTQILHAEFVGELLFDLSDVSCILAGFGMEDSKAVSTPLATGTKLIKNDAKPGKNEIQPELRLSTAQLSTVSWLARKLVILRG